MAIPATPTFTATISAAMITASKYNVSFTDVANMQARGAQDIKTELWDASKYDNFLATEVMLLVTTGTSAVTLPPDFDHEVTMRVFDGSVRGRAQAGQANAITLASTDGAADTDYVGWYAFTLAGTGAGQFSQITNYTSATKIASVSAAWTAPDSTTDYLIGQLWYGMGRTEDTRFWARNGRPSKYRIDGQVMSAWPPPDKVYPILMVYGPNLTMIDETATNFIAWLKQRMALVKQGIRVQTLLLVDDDRYPAELQRWEQMKARYGAENCQVAQTEASR